MDVDRIAVVHRPAHSSSVLVHPDIVDEHARGEDGGIRWGAGHLPANRQVEQQENGWSYTQVGVCVLPTVRYGAPSSNQVTESGDHSTAKMWNASAKRAPPGNVAVPPRPDPANPGPCIVPSTVPGHRSTTSITSISPRPGQPAPAMSSPIIQNAGHLAGPPGTRIRASNRPYRWAKLPSVVSRAEGMSQLP